MPNVIENAASKLYGSAKKAKGALYGLTGVFRTLMKEHGEIAVLLLEAQASSDPEKRSRVWSSIRKELLAHERCEMAVVYPLYAERAETRQYAIEHNEVTNELKYLIASIDEAAPEDPEWASLLDRLIVLVRRHVHDEEASFFPAGQRAFADLTEELDAVYRDKKGAIMLELS